MGDPRELALKLVALRYAEQRLKPALEEVRTGQGRTDPRGEDLCGVPDRR